MLGKLLKYEFKSTARIFLPFYIALFGVAVILKLFMALETTLEIMILPQVLFGILYVALMIAVFSLAYVISCMRFYKNLLGDEGYLMHTLPVKPYLHIWTKLITGVVWLTASICAGLLSVLILALRSGLFSDIAETLDQMFAALGIIINKPSVTATIVAFTALFVVSIINGFMMFYASMSVGQLVRGHRIIGAIASYFAFNILTQIISTVLIVVIARTDVWSALQKK